MALIYYGLVALTFTVRHPRCQFCTKTARNIRFVLFRKNLVICKIHISNVEVEFLLLAEKLKLYTKEKMKIEPFPWLKGYRVNMDELFTELTLDKVERKLLGEETWTLQSYEDMFSCNESQQELIKILIKADPGMGKTTLGKKVTRDWATGLFKKFSIVFFVALKFMKPSDPIEAVIMQQYPE